MTCLYVKNMQKDPSIYGIYVRMHAADVRALLYICGSWILPYWILDFFEIDVRLYPPFLV